MKLSVTKKLVCILVALLLLSCGTIYFVASYNYSKTLENVLQNNITAAQQNLAAITEAKLADTKNAAALAANQTGLAAAVHNKDSEALKTLAANIMQQTNISIVTITDTEGNVLVRGHTDNKGDNIFQQQPVAQASRGTSSAGIISGVEAISMRATTPIKMGATVVGTLSLGESLSNPKYLDWLAGLLDVRVTFFKGDTRLMTTITDKQGKRIVGTKLNNPLIENTVLNQGRIYFGESTIMGEKYSAAYWPAKNLEGQTIGMWFLGLPVQEVFMAEKAARSYTLLWAGIVLIVMLLIAIAVGFRFTAPINRIAAYASKVAHGDDSATLHITTQDEFGVLAESLQSMVQNLKEQAHWYNSVLDALPINVSVTDMDRKWIFVNAAGLKGTNQKLSDIMGLPCHSRGGNLCNTPDCGIDRLERGQSEAINTMPNGTVMQMMLSYLYDSKGEKIGHVEVGLNITEQERIKQDAAIATENMRQSIISQMESVVLALDEAAQLLADSITMAEEDAKNTANHMMNVTLAIEEMENTIQDVAHNASQAAKDAADTQEQAQEGHSIVQLIVSDILSVQNSSNNLKVDMEKLSEHANSIGAILNIIRDIADQTNLLALNAAIEAARAGEAGRGFAVVADEVRKLAEKTMDATKEVETAIHIIQQRTEESGRTMETTVQAVGKATEGVNTAGTTLNEIVHLSMSTSDGVSVIATAAEEQAATTSTISRTVVDSNQLAQRLSTSMEETSHTVRNVASQASELRSILEKM